MDGVSIQPHSCDVLVGHKAYNLMTWHPEVALVQVSAPHHPV